MPKLRKGELRFYLTMNPTELSKYVMDYPENSEYVRTFLEKYEYNWVKESWKRGNTI